MNNFPTPQKKPNIAEQQKMMEMVKTKGKPTAEQDPKITKAKNDLRRIIKQVGIDPQRIIQAGKYAEQALKDPKMYPVALNMAVKNGLLTQDQLPKEPGINWKLLAQGMTAGKLTEELVKEGLV